MVHPRARDSLLLQVLFLFQILQGRQVPQARPEFRGLPASQRRQKPQALLPLRFQQKHQGLQARPKLRVLPAPQLRQKPQALLSLQLPQAAQVPQNLQIREVTLWAPQRTHPWALLL